MFAFSIFPSLGWFFVNSNSPHHSKDIFDLRSRMTELKRKIKSSQTFELLNLITEAHNSRIF